jgi:hypothetical protein
MNEATDVEDDPEALRVRHHMATQLGILCQLARSERSAYLGQWVAAAWTVGR